MYIDEKYGKITKIILWFSAGITSEPEEKWK